MNIDVLAEDDDSIRFVLEDATPAFANALRRTMIAKVPTMAVKEVDFVDNTSGLFDEMVAHRLGMVPWTFPAGEYNLPEECDCDDGCKDCQVTLVLEREGEASVTAADLKPTDKQVETPNPDILIAKLLDGQEMELEAHAVLGRGEDHAKHQAANAAYRYRPVVTVNGDEVDNAVEAARLAPDAVRDADGAVEADDDIVYAMEDAIDVEEGDEVELVEQDDAFIFTVESVSGLEPREIMERAADILEEELDSFEDAAKDALSA
ncbi:MAG: DNA-directed RNA polymerase subunit D [Candidatus Nanohaloarchaea archaeon]|nr:DNA-directed RNA polymerase subunit D [Candidatus Nanohaloarchaea archaeon]